MPTAGHAQSSKLELGGTELSPILVRATALTCGVLAALAMQIYLAGFGFDLVAIWQSLSSGKGMQLRTAGPWWAMAGAAFIVSGVVAATLSRLPPPWHRLRLLRWVAGAALVFLLEDISHSVTMQGSAAANLAATLAALAIAALMAMLGAFFSNRR
jgi:hypothetical protein